MKKDMKIFFIINCTFSAWLFRKGLMRTLVEQGHDVTLLAPYDSKYQELIRKIGVKYVPLHVERFFGPLSDIRLFFRLWRLLKKHQPDVVHNFTIKPNIYGTFAARLAGIKKIICTVTGLGDLFVEGAGFGLKLMRGIASFMYKCAFALCAKVSFQNDDDLNFFVNKKIIKKNKAVLIRSSGVDMVEFHPNVISSEKQSWIRTELGIDADTIVVSMFARAHWAKGVREFVEASKQISSNNKKYIFLLVGWVESGKMSVPKEYLLSEQSVYFQWIGFREDVRSYLAISNIIVLPSYYREGIPRSLLEAMAMGKPIITTDNIGCREIVDDGVNGYLVPPKDVPALKESISKLLDDSSKREAFGNASLAKVKREFSETMVIEQTFSLLYS